MRLLDQQKVTGFSGLMDTFSFCFDVNSVCIIRFVLKDLCVYLYISVYSEIQSTLFFVVILFVLTGLVVLVNNL